MSCACAMVNDWETEYDVNKIYELRCKTTLYFGCGAISKIDQICADLKAKDISKVLVVATKSAYIRCGAWAVVEPALKNHKMEYVVFNEFKPNPQSDDVDAAVALGKKHGSQAVIAIGGGSAIDGGKAISILLHPTYSDKNAEELMLWKFAPNVAVPIVTINTTHGTGTEADRFSVVSVLTNGKKFKPLIALDCIYPFAAIDDPNLMLEMDINQTTYTSIDAFCHAIETSTTKIQSPYSIHLSQTAIRLIAEYLPRARKDLKDKQARYWLTYASALAGIAFDNSLLHLVHAMEHPLSGIKPSLTHGLGLGLLLPSVFNEIYHTNPKVIASCLKSIVPNATGENTEAEKKKVVEGMHKWLVDNGVKGSLKDYGYSMENVEELTNLVMTTPSLGVCVSMAPVEGTAEVISRIYKRAM